VGKSWKFKRLLALPPLAALVATLTEVAELRTAGGLPTKAMKSQ
jgi:hypothetical protein